MTTHYLEKRFDTAAEAASQLARYIADKLQAGIQERGQAVLAVSGGSSPKLLFKELSRIDLPWSQVTITQVDERWVEPDHADSNAKLIREHLLLDKAAAARFAPMKNPAPTPEAGQAQCEDMLRALPSPFDVIVLGMGEDGHTASLFPGAANLATALDTTRKELCTFMHPLHAPHPRMTLTLRALLASRLLILQLAGESKLAVFRKAQADGPIEEMPVRAVLRQKTTPLEVWYSR
jgi:6-phosphogluconolactonase